MNNQLTDPFGAQGALYFLPGQYLFKRIEAGREVIKALSGEQIARAFREHQTDTGWIMRRVLRWREEPSGNYLLSYEPPGIKTILIQTADQQEEEVVEISVPLPALVLLGHGRDYYLWAANGKHINHKTKLAPAPFPNIGGDFRGKVCFGSNEVPAASLEALDSVWHLIFKTPFNGDNAGQKCRSEPEDVRRLLMAIAAKNLKRFPSSELLETSTTISDVWAKVVGS